MLAHVIAVLCTAVLHVDCNSKGEAADGSLNKPFKSVEEVCSKLYSYQEDVIVKFHSGIYEIKEDIELRGVNNVVFESLEKNKPVLFTKSVKIGKDMIVDSEWRPLVCYNDEFATLARWPNKGFVKFKETDNEKSFKYTCTKFNKINFEKEEAYVCGYLAAEWQFDVRRIKSYKNSVVELDNMPKAPTEWKGPGRGRLYVCNLKSELDSPGEYYWDSKTKVVSFVKPKERIKDLRACVNKTIIILQGCSNVVVRNISFQYSQRDGIRLFDCKNCIVDSCSFKTIRENGIFIKGGNSCLVTNSVVYNAGSSGVLITSAGDRKKLIGCNHVVTNCKIDRIGFSDTTYVNCIRANGVGICIRNNVISNGRQFGVSVAGNDNLFENNEVYNMMLESCDGGAFYTGLDPLSRGNVYRYNYVHDVNGAGFYLDDCDAGDFVLSNRIVNVRIGVLIGCGQDNHVIGNVIEKCRCGVSVDDRGLTWMKWLRQQLIWKLEKLPYRSEVWMKKYPNLKSYESHDPCEPIHIDIIANKFKKCRTEIGLAEKVRLYMDFINIKK